MSVDPEFDKKIKLITSFMWLRVFTICACGTLLVWGGLYFSGKSSYTTPVTTSSSDSAKVEQKTVAEVVDGIHVESGLIAEQGYELVLQNCGACHSYKLVTQNRATEEGWLDMIRWMQKTQKLWDLGENEAGIIAYLGKHYGPLKKGRRANLTNIEWYEL